jgi:phosphoribosylformylglycinamidine synthase
MVVTKIVSTLSPWFEGCNTGEIHSIPVSHGEGRCVISEKEFISLSKNGQIAAQYVDFDGAPTMSSFFNPNGSDFAIEAMTSPDGRILGKMGHSERAGSYVHINVPGEKDQKIFESGVAYFR